MYKNGEYTTLSLSKENPCHSHFSSVFFTLFVSMLYLFMLIFFYNSSDTRLAALSLFQTKFSAREHFKCFNTVCTCYDYCPFRLHPQCLQSRLLQNLLGNWTSYNLFRRLKFGKEQKYAYTYPSL